jgi:phosphoribosylaminoimidazole-succinocarboxamide synthase
MTSTVLKADVGNSYTFVASGKVRDIFEIDSETLLFIATDRISAYDVILTNVNTTLASC